MRLSSITWENTRVIPHLSNETFASLFGAGRGEGKLINAERIPQAFLLMGEEMESNIPQGWKELNDYSNQSQSDVRLQFCYFGWAVLCMSTDLRAIGEQLDGMTHSPHPPSYFNFFIPFIIFDIARLELIRGIFLKFSELRWQTIRFLQFFFKSMTNTGERIKGAFR